MQLHRVVENNHEKAYCNMMRTTTAKDKRDAEINSLAKSLYEKMSDQDYSEIEDKISSLQVQGYTVFGIEHIDPDDIQKALEMLFYIKATKITNNQKACYQRVFNKH